MTIHPDGIENTQGLFHIQFNETNITNRRAIYWLWHDGTRYSAEVYQKRRQPRKTTVYREVQHHQFRVIDETHIVALRWQAFFDSLQWPMRDKRGVGRPRLDYLEQKDSVLYLRFPTIEYTAVRHLTVGEMRMALLMAAKAKIATMNNRRLKE